MEWFIQLHRKILEWEWYDEPKTFAVFLHCLLKANWKEKNWRWKTIERWTFITSLDKLSKELKLSVRSVRTALDKLESTSELTKEWHASYTLIKVNKYNEYQTNDKLNDKLPTNERQATDKRTTTTNKVNKDNKEKNIVVATKVATLKEYMISNINKEYFINNYNTNEETITKEMREFYLYRSEKKPNWKKELWQMQKTFDVSRRFHKWLWNSNKWNKQESEEDERRRKLKELEEKRKDLFTKK